MIDGWASYALADFVPFTAEVYFRLIERVNTAWWPLQLPAVALGLTALAFAWRGRARPALLLLVPAWAAGGAVFHLRHYIELNWAAAWFGGAFLAQAALLLGLALARGVHERHRGHTPRDAVAAALALCGLVGYPAVALIAGHGWARAEVFALHPDPTAVATLGVVLVALRGVRAGLAALVPLLWLAVATLTLLALEAAWAWLLPGAVALALAAAVVPGRFRATDDLK